MADDPLPCPTEAELLAAGGYPHLPLRVRHAPAPSWHPVRDGDEVARYLYETPGGEPLFERIRFHRRGESSAAPEKAFLTRRACGGGRWAWGLDGVETVLYRLPRVRAATAAGERVYVVEGEKDVHALEALGLTATTAPLGALQWTERHAGMLRGADVVVIPDGDRVGKVHAGRVMASLRGRARSVALLLLPGHKDVSDWLAAGNGADELLRLADAAPRDASPAAVAAALELPPDVDPLTSSPAALRALMTNAPPAPSTPHPGFARSLSAFARLGVAVAPRAEPAEPGLGPAHPTYRAVTGAVRDAEAGLAPLLEDASLLDRAAYELGLFAGLLRAAMAADPLAPAREGDPPGPAFLASPSVRVVRTRRDWDAYLRDPGAGQPPEREVAWLVNLPPTGPLQVRRLDPLPAILLEACARPLTREGAVAAVAERVQGDTARIEAMVHAQIGGLGAAGLLHPAPDAAGRTIDDMRALLLADEAPRGDARNMLGALSRTLIVARAYAEAAGAAPDRPFNLHRLDRAVDGLEHLLEGARLRAPFVAELEGYWSGADAGARLGALEPLLRALERALGRGTHALPPVVLP